MGTMKAHTELKDLRGMGAKLLIFGARSRTRTGTDLSVLGILSPVCLPNSTIRAGNKRARSIAAINRVGYVRRSQLNLPGTVLNNRLHKKRRQHERDRRQQFDQHVQTGTRGIFKRIT